MPDSRQHRGPHPQDRQLFSGEHRHALRQATADLGWLLTKGYASTSALKLVGDRYRLTARQRLAVSRCACGEEQRDQRRQHCVGAADLEHRELWIDGYNVLTSVEAALAGMVILHAQDACFRDMASMHGNYRTVKETMPAIRLLGQLLSQWKVSVCRWYLDAPVSNSGRLKSLLQKMADEYDWAWSVELVADPDPILTCSGQVVASADSQIIDKAQCWFNLAREVIESEIPDAWVLDLSNDQ